MAMSNWPQLLAYVMKFGPLNQQQAEQWLDSRCPQWRSGPDVMAAGQIWMAKAGGKVSAIKIDEQNNKPSSDRTRLIRLVQVGRRALGLDEETYRELLTQQSGKRSAADLTLQELDKVLVAMKAAGFKPTVKRPVKGAASQRLSPVSGALVRTGEIGVIRAVWITMHRHGLLRDGSETALNHYVERQTVRINKGIGVAEVAWLSEALAYRVLESLKNWHKREMVKALQSAKRTVPINEKTGRVAGYQAVLGVFEEMLHG